MELPTPTPPAPPLHQASNEDEVLFVVKQKFVILNDVGTDKRVRNLADSALARPEPVHREIYLSDPRKVASEKNRTTIRFFGLETTTPVKTESAGTGQS